ncbi:hypothetical protein Q428_11570 [Fervidicella metallireducens AeB]|uniref:Uncharacterized protein n=1 Tax=Fervidicella metallireducens AeB TaxID=1403537 RepID=A0A017RSY6_9CLOT|nr:hypothetical protein [Fervidicella metallireducens]EYE87782.1 hypothetical protein Q428_11570 [Fervidicella metallireducens AeB]
MRKNILTGVIVIFLVMIFGTIITFNNIKAKGIYDVILEPFRAETENIYNQSLEAAKNKSDGKIDESILVKVADREFKRIYENNPKMKDYCSIKEVSLNPKIKEKDKDALQVQLVLKINSNAKKYLRKEEVTFNLPAVSTNQ